MKSTKVILSLLLTICFCFAGCSSDVNYVDDTKVNLADLIETTAESTVVETIAPTTVHTHEYIKATCTEAKKCKTCDFSKVFINFVVLLASRKQQESNIAQQDIPQ